MWPQRFGSIGVGRIPGEELRNAISSPDSIAALKSLREQQGLSISEMAERTGMDRAMISRLESGRLDNPTLATVSRYAKALGKRVVVNFVDVGES